MAAVWLLAGSCPKPSVGATLAIVSKPMKPQSQLGTEINPILDLANDPSVLDELYDNPRPLRESSFKI